MGKQYASLEAAANEGMRVHWRLMELGRQVTSEAQLDDILKSYPPGLKRQMLAETIRRYSRITSPKS